MMLNGLLRVDTAQAYRNETEAGEALRKSGLDRKDVYITTKYSGSNGLDIETSIQDSLRNVRRVVGVCNQILLKYWV
jgi:diketogulonate reductase-like aldo/keto reductase